MLGHLTGQGLKAAERILSKGKGAGANTEHIKAIDRASSDFRYMVVRPVKAETDGAGMADPVALLLKAYAELTGAQKRKFKASI
jgi:hypothetical protein